MEEKLVSVIMPAYNVEKYIGRSLHSLLSQTYKNIEIIVVNDGSKDKTEEVIKAYSKIDSRIKYVYQDNDGPSLARNKGLDCAKGEYIFFIDSDDFIRPDGIEVLYNKMIETRSDMAAGGYFKVDEKNADMVKFTKKPKYKVNIYPPSAVCQKMFTNNNLIFAVCWGKLFRRDIIENNNLRFDVKAKYGEDYLFNYEYLKHVDKVCGIEKFKIICYLQRKTSLVHGKFNINVLTSLYGIKKICEELEQNDSSQLLYARTWRFWQSFDVGYKMWKSRFVDEQLNLEIVNNLNRDIDVLKQNKKIVLYRRMFAPMLCKLMCRVIKKRVKKEKKKLQVEVTSH